MACHSRSMPTSAPMAEPPPLGHRMLMRRAAPGYCTTRAAPLAQLSELAISDPSGSIKRGAERPFRPASQRSLVRLACSSHTFTVRWPPGAACAAAAALLNSPQMVVALPCRKVQWLILDWEGHKTVVEADKRQLIQAQALDIPIRDMRLMDPALGALDTQHGQVSAARRLPLASPLCRLARRFRPRALLAGAGAICCAFCQPSPCPCPMLPRPPLLKSASLNALPQTKH